MIRFFLFYILVVFSALLNAQDMTSITSFSQAKKLLSNATSPPDFQQAKPVTLPDHWQHQSDEFYGSAWYQISFPLQHKTAEQWAIYLPDINMNAEIWLNNTRLGSGGRMQAPLSRYWHSPMIFSFSPSELKAKNRLQIRVVAYANEFGKLGKIHIGSRDRVNALYEKHFFSTVTIHIISGALAGVYALFMGVVWWKRRDPVFFWGALVCAAWSISSMNIYIINPPVAELIWEKIMLTSMGWIPLLFFFFILRLDDIPYKKYPDQVALFIATLLNAALILSPASMLFSISRLWHIYAMAFGLAGVAFLFYSWIKYRQQKQLIMLIAFALIASCGLHDLLAQNQLLEHSETLWLDYSVPIILLLIGYLMISRFLSALSSYERLNNELGMRVQQAQNKIETDYEKILGLEIEQAENNERERIYRNMHDDMGAKLLSMIYQSEPGEMNTLARSAMNDLRAIVSKTQGNKYQLKDTLEKWQHISHKRCKEAGFNCHWSQNKIPDDIILKDTSDKNLQRIQTEAITNAIKHSHGKNIFINIRYRLNCLYTQVTDDGDSSQNTHWIEGRGMNSMRYRIKKLGGNIRWKVTPNTKTRISWLIPLDKNQEQ
ncbi:MAG: hypothetical protein GXP22_10830 [Gammaproteobacteria bacterium]|nr:hypothetical protein [Gammaproteobacteria bacterium]